MKRNLHFFTRNKPLKTDAALYVITYNGNHAKLMTRDRDQDLNFLPTTNPRNQKGTTDSFESFGTRGIRGSVLRLITLEPEL